MNRQYMLFVLLLLMCLNIQAQKNVIGLSATYFAESGYHNGAEIGVEYPLVAAIKKRELLKKSGKQVIKKKYHDFLIGMELGLYNHPNNRKTLMINPTLIHRFTITRGFNTEIGLGLGYFRTFYNVPTYELVSDTEIREIKRAGRSSFNPSILFGLGYDLSKKHKAPLAFNIRPSLILQVPYNSAFVLLPAWEFRITYFLKKKNEDKKL